MAKITRNTATHRQFGSAPYGNLSVLAYRIQTNASGAVINSDSTAAVAIGDVIDLGTIPAGMRLDDFVASVSTGMSASVTGKLGFAYADGVDSAAVPQDDAYFGTGLNLNTAAILRNASAKAPVVLPKEARLILTTAGAANAKVSQIDIRLYGEMTGPK